MGASVFIFARSASDVPVNLDIFQDVELNQHRAEALDALLVRGGQSGTVLLNDVDAGRGLDELAELLLIEQLPRGLEHVAIGADGLAATARREQASPKREE